MLGDTLSIQTRALRLCKLMCVGLLTIGAAAAQEQEQLEFDSAKAFSRLPPIGGINVSPDGKMAVVLRPVADTYHVATVNLDTGASNLLMAANPEEFLFNWCRFANNTRVVCSIRSYVIPQSASTNITNIAGYRGGGISASRLLAINTDGSNQMQLVKTKKSNVGGKLQWIDWTQDNVVSWLVDEPNHILVALSREDRLYPSVYRLNINNNRIKKVQSFRAGIFGWGATRDGKIIHGYGRSTDNKARAIYVGDNKATELDMSHLVGEQTMIPLGYTPDGSSAYVLANAGKNIRSVIEIDSKTARIKRILGEASTHDAQGLVLNSSTGEALAIRELSDKLYYQWLDPELAKEFNAVAAALPNAPSSVRLESFDTAVNKIVVLAWGAGTHPTYYLYNRAKKALTKLASSYSNVPATKIGERLAVSYKARDGINVPAYLTLPSNKNPEKLPTIILPHGGPYARDTDNFDYWSQFLANLGYAVLQPNYRGSTGYGDDYFLKGFKQWGLAMQDDLDDGLAWMIEQGYTDANRVCILGGSYGGYAALVASFKSTDKYRCAVSFAGVSDLDALFDRWAIAFQLTSAARRLQNGSLRDQYSPLKRVKDIGIPLLLVHGDADERVPVGHSRSLAAALQRAKKPHTYIELPNGDHHLSLQSHRETFLSAVQDFLAEHLSASDVVALK